MKGYPLKNKTHAIVTPNPNPNPKRNPKPYPVERSSSSMHVRELRI